MQTNTPQEVKEWIREDEFGNIVARGIVGEDDPYEVQTQKVAEEDDDAEKAKAAAAAQVEGATTNRWGLASRCLSLSPSLCFLTSTRAPFYFTNKRRMHALPVPPTPPHAHIAA